MSLTFLTMAVQAVSSGWLRAVFWHVLKVCCR